MTNVVEASETALLDWPNFWDGGPGVPECEITDRYIDTCIERQKGMRRAIKNVHKIFGATESEKMLDRPYQSRSARIAAMGLALRASDEQLAKFCRIFSKERGTTPVPMLPEEFDSTEHLMLESLQDGQIIALPYMTARVIYAEMHIMG